MQRASMASSSRFTRSESVDPAMMFPSQSAASSFQDVSSTNTTTQAPSSGSSMRDTGSRRSLAAAIRDRSQSWAVPSSNPTVARAQTANRSHLIDEKASGKLQREVARAVKVVDTFLSPKLLKDQSIPKELLVEANGLVFLTVYKAGFFFSGKIGNGFVIARTAAGWSAPSFITSGGLGFGIMAGGEVVNYMIVLSSRSAVKVFTRNGQFQLGSELDIAVGPIGRAASASLNVGRGGFAPNYSYSHSMGLYGGIGLSSALICTRKSLNAKCYGSSVTARQILGGEVPCPLAVPLWQALDRALGVTRQYVDGLPVLPPALSGIRCDACGHTNTTENSQCSRCRNLLVYSVSIHSGKRNVGELVVADQFQQPAASSS
ncbi:hypothetical protein Poli38472_001784 [Pythium oligandrum]|uniref:Ysc84 actin-binding domain-containing protein n=1 Tax=Pythium oligandrum TaxID=41045 RepID=A0A8K1FTI6_PYTOL|nr:hypothetical protein Poli38472_001784 [Pythium oligandrum]|eukprot:TMW69628.1 hypothetical protein Poli38472_001784 [Pythium oligandrum]